MADTELQHRFGSQAAEDGTSSEESEVAAKGRMSEEQALSRRHRVDIGSHDGRHIEHDGDPDSQREPPASTLMRLGWFFVLWLGGVVTITLVGLAIRSAIMP